MDHPNVEQPGHPTEKDPGVPTQVAGGPAPSPSPSPAPAPLTVGPEKKEGGDGSDAGQKDLNPKPEVSANASEAKASPPNKSPKSVRWSERLVSESTFSAPVDPDLTPSPPGTGSGGGDPYVACSSFVSSSTSFRERMNGVRDVLGRWGSNVKEAAKKAETVAGNTWQHLKTSPSFTDAAMGRIAHTTKILAEGGYDNIFRHTFETTPDEQLRNTYACYLSTSAGPVMGALYISTSKLAFCSDSPLPYKNGDQTEWSYYKVVIPLHQLKAVNQSSSRMNPAEKYIQIISVDSHEFWYMGFLNYEGAVLSLQEDAVSRSSQSF